MFFTLKHRLTQGKPFSFRESSPVGALTALPPQLLKAIRTFFFDRNSQRPIRVLFLPASALDAIPSGTVARETALRLAVSGRVSG